MTLKMITVPCDDDQEGVEVGTLGEFQHRLKMMNDPEYHDTQVRAPKSLRDVLGIPKGLSLRDVLLKRAA